MPSLQDVLSSPELQGIYRLEIIRQTILNSGGCAALATVLRHFGMYASERMLFDSLNPNIAVGLFPEQIVRCVCEKGLIAHGFTDYPAGHIIDRARGGQMTLLRRNDRADHWIIAAGIEPLIGMMVFADPSAERSVLTTMSIDDFEKRWSGTEQLAILISQPTSYSHSKKNSTKRMSFRIFSYTARQSITAKEKAAGKTNAARMRKRAAAGVTP
jgi:ABC-type bacteriocin/lantibiotic exporter with double-glycine peptidase domain